MMKKLFKLELESSQIQYFINKTRLQLILLLIISNDDIHNCMELVFYPLFTMMNDDMHGTHCQPNM